MIAISRLRSRRRPSSSVRPMFSSRSSSRVSTPTSRDPPAEPSGVNSIRMAPLHGAAPGLELLGTLPRAPTSVTLPWFIETDRHVAQPSAQLHCANLLLLSHPLNLAFAIDDRKTVRPAPRMDHSPMPHRYETETSIARGARIARRSAAPTRDL